MKRYLALGLAAAVLLVVAACNQAVAPSGADFEAMADHPYQVAWLGHGKDSEKCAPLSPDDPRADFGDDGYIHWVFATKGASTAAGTELRVWLDGVEIAGSPFSPGHPLNANVWHFYTPFPDDLVDANGNVDPDELVQRLSATIYLDGAPGQPARLVISDFCPGEPTVVEETLDVEKTAETSFKRTHHWDIAKRVETDNELLEDGTPKIWLYTDGSGDETATWIIDVTYEGYTDSDFVVSGTITITNPGTNTQTFTITSVKDNLGAGGADFDADCSVTFPYDLAPGETLECTYSEEVTAEEAAEGGINTAMVYVDHEDFDDPFLAFAGWAFDFDDPDEELYATVNVNDISDLFGEVNLGTVTAPNGDTFTYDKEFTYEGYEGECGDFEYDNTATIVETEQSADATLKVNVQCLVFEGETAWASNQLGTPLTLRYTPRGNWATYVKYKGFEASGKTTTLYAGQTINVGTVHFSAAASGQVTITVSLTGDWEFEDVAENLKVQGYSSAPSGNPSPGLFAHKKTCDPDESTCSITVPQNNFYGVHVLVGQWVPDPDFGP